MASDEMTAAEMGEMVRTMFQNFLIDLARCLALGTAASYEDLAFSQRDLRGWLAAASKREEKATEMAKRPTKEFKFYRFNGGIDKESEYLNRMVAEGWHLEPQVIQGFTDSDGNTSDPVLLLSRSINHPVMPPPPTPAPSKTRVPR